MRRSSPRSTLFPYTTLFRSFLQAGFLIRPGRFEKPAYETCPFKSVGALTCPSNSRCRQSANRSSKAPSRSEEHTSELQSRFDLVCRLLLEKKNEPTNKTTAI